MKSKFFLSLLLSIFCIPLNAQTIRYVKPNSSGNADASSWANASSDLQATINASAAGDKVWVAGGTYRPTQDPFGNTNPANSRNKTFYLKSGVSIHGGFSGTESLFIERNLKLNPTILSGDIGTINDVTDNCFHVVLSVVDVTKTTLDGFIVMKGNANIPGASPTNMVVEGKTIECYNGSGLYTHTTSTTISNCIFSENIAILGGGIYSNSDVGLELQNNILEGNTASRGAGIFNVSTKTNATNCIFAKNTVSGSGAAVYNASTSNVNLFNCTIAGNFATTSGAGVFNEFNTVPVIKNTVIWGNAGGGNIGIANNSFNQNVSNSIIQGPTVYAGVANSNQNPLFIDASDYDGGDNIWLTADDGLRLDCNSPAVNKGSNTITITTDILNAPTFEARRDIGAYEAMCTIYAFATPACRGMSLSGVSGNGWFEFYDEYGIICSINPNGMNLGTVTVETSDATGSIFFNSDNYLGRSVNVYCSNYPNSSMMPQDYRLRIFYYRSELTEYNLAVGGHFMKEDFNVMWQKDGTGCSLPTYYGGKMGLVDKLDVSSKDFGINNNGFYLEFLLNHFTIFAATTQGLRPLPIEYLSFSGETKKDKNILQWSISTQTNCDYFEIQRSNGLTELETIGEMDHIKNGNNSNNYTFEDKEPVNGINYYRLKGLDANGVITYSDMISLKYEKPTQIVVYPNPTVNEVNILTFNKKQRILLFDNQNRLMFTDKTIPEKIDFSIYPNGLYLLVIGEQTFKILKE